MTDVAERERAAVARLVDLVAHGCKATSTWYERDAAPPAADRADLVVSTDAWAGGDWRAHVASLAARAARALVVVRANPDRIGAGLGRGGPDPDDLLRVLWEIGRVRDHAYLVFPRAVEAVAAVAGSVRAPDVALAPVGSLVRRTARLHALVVDTTPRTPQARRRLRIAGASGEPA